jgi:uracil-DNA glycosylase family 4
MNVEDKILELVKQTNPDNPMSYVQNIVKGYSIEKLNSHIMGCKDCEEICEYGKSITLGNPNASVLIIGDGISDPSCIEDGVCYPFSSKESQEVLDIAFDALHVNREEIFYINAVNCWTHKLLGDEKVNRTPNKKEVNNCSVFVDYAINTIQPLVIILFGSIALNLYRKEAIKKARGEWIDIKGIPAMPTYHPAYFSKLEGKQDEEIIANHKWEFFQDVRNAFLYIQENYPDTGVLLEPIVKD